MESSVAIQFALPFCRQHNEEVEGSRTIRIAFFAWGLFLLLAGTLFLYSAYTNLSIFPDLNPVSWGWFSAISGILFIALSSCMRITE